MNYLNFKVAIMVMVVLSIAAQESNKDIKYEDLEMVTDMGLSVNYSSGGSGCSIEAASVPEPGCTQLSWDNDDFLTASWEQPSNLSATAVEVLRCFSKESTKNRAWRKAKDIIRKDKQCKKVGTVALSDALSYKYVIPSDAAEATYFIRLLVKCGDGKYDYCGDVNSEFDAGLYYSIKPMDSIPPGLVAGVVIAVIIAPAFLVLYFVYEFVILKK